VNLSQPLAGLRVAVSRRPFPALKRQQVLDMLVSLGARVADEVSTATDFVLCDAVSLDAAATPKIRAAIAFNIPILLPGDFDKLKAGAPLGQLGFRAIPPKPAVTLPLPPPPSDSPYGARF
jgi:BRCT domain type II-containing protein